MNETESHSSSLSKFLKQLLFVFNGAGKKKKERKEKRKQCIPETLRKTSRREASAASHRRGSWGRASQTFYAKTPNKRGEENIAPGTSGSIKINENR